MHIFHKWSKWATYDSGPISRYYFHLYRTVQTGSFERQKRVCDKCGKIELRTVETEFE